MKGWEREQKIKELLLERGAVSMTEVCAITGASVATVRRDFEELQKKGLAERTHGGLRLPQKQPERRRYVNGTEILDEIDKEKQLIAQEAAAQVHAGESIFIGAGKTCNMLAALLGDVERLTVVTTSVPPCWSWRSARMFLSRCSAATSTRARIILRRSIPTSVMCCAAIILIKYF